MSKTKRYIEEQLEKGIDVLHPEWLNTQIEESYGNYGMAKNENRKKGTSNKQIRETEGTSGICSDLPF
jgi:hypothetical protein